VVKVGLLERWVCLLKSAERPILVLSDHCNLCEMPKFELQNLIYNSKAQYFLSFELDFSFIPCKLNKFAALLLQSLP
jgi:hypothetical protein